MNALDVLYTPLDCPPQPEFDISQLKTWIQETHPKQEYIRLKMSENNKTAEGKVDNYPWNLTIAFLKMSNAGTGWQNGFDVEFPELSNWLTDAFGVSLDDIGLIILLPVKQDHIGRGFWHNDPDTSGLRLYLEFENKDYDKLLMKRTLLPLDKRIPFTSEFLENPDEHFHPEILECNILSNKQCFYLNNVRGIHAIETNKIGATRIAAFLVSKDGCEETLMAKTNDLIVRSATKYKDYSIYWKK